MIIQILDQNFWIAKFKTFEFQTLKLQKFANFSKPRNRSENNLFELFNNLQLTDRRKLKSLSANRIVTGTYRNRCKLNSKVCIPSFEFETSLQDMKSQILRIKLL